MPVPAGPEAPRSARADAGQGRLGVGIASLVAHLRHQPAGCPCAASSAIGRLLDCECRYLVDWCRRLLHRAGGVTALPASPHPVRPGAKARRGFHADDGLAGGGAQRLCLDPGDTGGRAVRRAAPEPVWSGGHRALARRRTSPASLSATSTPPTSREDGTSAPCCPCSVGAPAPRPTSAQDLRRAGLETRVWAAALTTLEKRVRQCVLHPPATPAQRQQLQRRLLLQVQALGDQFLHVLDHPCRALAWRLWHFQQELLTCVAQSGVPPDNNLAERAIRPLVIARKISGGTQSPHGSATRMQLYSLAATWTAQGHNPLAEFRRLLQSPLPQL